MPLSKKPLLFALPLVILTFLAFGLISDKNALLPLINSSFLASMLLLIAGAILLVVRSGFFTVFAMGFVKLKRFFFRKPRVMEQEFWQSEKSNPIYQATSFLLWAGILVLLFSLGLTLFYLFR